MLACLQAAWAQIFVPQLPADKGPALSADYEVAVRQQSGGEWQQVPVLRCDVNTHRVQRPEYLSIEFGSSPRPWPADTL